LSVLLRLENITHRYGDGPAVLNDVSLTLDQGEMAFVTGPSGAGKSTLLNLIALLERPTQGRVIVNGTPLSSVRPAGIPTYRRQLGLIFQNFNLLNDRSVFDNVAVPLRIRGQADEDIARRVRAALDAVGLLGKEAQLPPSLSGGEQQRVGIARAIVTKPRLLLADEPTGNLDPDMARDIMQLFMRFNQFGVSVLVATHAIGLIHKLPYRIMHLENGELMTRREAHAPRNHGNAGRR
jgi:cell division transport system ATP-binding protein